MSAPRARIARIRTAVRQGAERPCEDRVLTTPNAVIVLDGATGPARTDQTGGWLADTIGTRLYRTITDHPDVDLAEALASTIASVANKNELQPGMAPSTTVSIARWNEDAVDVLVLGDSPVIGITRDRRILQARDDRLANIAVAERTALRATTSGSPGEDRTAAWARLVDAQRQYRNRPGGYWIAEACPDAAHNAIRARWDTRNLTCILAMTDGVSNGVDRYGIPRDWLTASELARVEPSRLVNLVHKIEAGDPDRHRWPRSKRHDDKAIAVVDFEVSPSLPQ